MKLKGIAAVAIAALFCVGAMAVFAGTDTSAADPGLDKGYAYGQSFELDMKKLDAEFKKTSSAGLLDTINGAILENLGDLNDGSAVSIDSASIKNIDFKILFASMIEVVEANENGYVIDYLNTFMFDFKIAAEINGKLPKAGTYDYDYEFQANDVQSRTVGFSGSVFVGYELTGTIELTPDGDLKSISLKFEIYAYMNIESGITITSSADGMKETISYNKTKYEAKADFGYSFKLVFTDDLSGNYEVSVEQAKMDGGITINDAAKAFFDMVYEEPGFVDNKIMNLTAPDGTKVLVNGKLSSFDLNELLEEANGGDPLKVPKADTEAMMASIEYNPYNLLTDTPFGDMAAAAGIEELFEGLEARELNPAEKNDVKNTASKVRTGINTAKNVDTGKKDNTMLYVAIGAVALGAVAVIAYFVFIRKP